MTVELVEILVTDIAFAEKPLIYFNTLTLNSTEAAKDVYVVTAELASYIVFVIKILARKLSQ